MLKNLIDPNETILWQGKPHHFLYTLGNPLIYPFALCWGIFDLFFMTKFNAASHGIFPFMNFFMFLHLTPVWYALFSPVYRFFNWYRIDYACISPLGLSGWISPVPNCPKCRICACMWA